MHVKSILVPLYIPNNTETKVVLPIEKSNEVVRLNLGRDTHLFSRFIFSFKLLDFKVIKFLQFVSHLLKYCFVFLRRRCTIQEFALKENEKTV